jgi:uncharacterized membrane protein
VFASEFIGTGSFAFKAFLFLHILCAIVGFGGVMLNGVYASRAKKRPPAEALAVMEVNTFVSLRVAEYFIYATLVLGLGLVGLSDKVFKFSQTWIGVSCLIYVVALAVSVRGLQPSVRKLLDVQRELVASPAGIDVPSKTAMAGALEKRIGMYSGFLHLAMAVILVMMIWKPGFN